MALKKMQIPLNKIVIVSGSGCFAKIADRPNVNSVKMLHGRVFSGTSPHGSITATFRYELPEYGFDICKLVEAAGAAYVARTTAYDVLELQKMMADATAKKGFALIDVLTACPAHYGRLNKWGNTAEKMMRIKDLTVPVAKAKSMLEEELKGKFLTGKLVDRVDPIDARTRCARMAEEARSR